VALAELPDAGDCSLDRHLSPFPDSRCQDRNNPPVLRDRKRLTALDFVEHPCEVGLRFVCTESLHMLKHTTRLVYD